MAIAEFAKYALLNPLLVRCNAIETAQNILAHETQFRVAAICFLSVVLLAALYLVLKPANRGLALIGTLFRLVFAFVMAFCTLNLLAAHVFSARGRHRKWQR